MSITLEIAMVKEITGSSILLAISNDESADSLMEMGLDLSLRFQKSLRLVHVSEGEQTEDVKSWMSRLVQQKEIEGGDVLESAEVDRAILGYAKEHSAAFIICGTAREAYKFGLRGISTAFGLMALGHIPVLALPKGTRWSTRDREGLVLVAADDLEKGSETVLEFGLSLAATRQDLLIHCHVNAPQMWHFNDQVVNAKDLLTQRAQRFIEATPSYSHENYKTLVLDGDVNEAVEKAADQVDADLIIFGRHRPVRVAPLRLGRVPLHAMLTHGRPVAVVPLP